MSEIPVYIGIPLAILCITVSAFVITVAVFMFRELYDLHRR